ncbi:uncharacterized protein A4U43_C08F10030 [Asparagus officinalis]|nr:uncharacterized protein A4U43_C08F10030 [Asparagus officinalis]
MPTVSVGRDRLFEALGKAYTQEEFDELCFEFGIELDDVTTEKAIIRKEKHLQSEENGDEDGEEIIYKIEVPANSCVSNSSLQVLFGGKALPPSEINFVPLKQVKKFRADELMEFYKSDLKLKKFLHIIEDSPVYPVIYDSNRTVLSLPPIINGAHSAINLKTKNVFIECTATDLTKAKIVLNTMVTMFSEYCERKYEVEPVHVVYPDKRTSEIKSSVDVHSRRDIYPDLSVTSFKAPVSEITYCNGGNFFVCWQVVPLLNKMQLQTEQSTSGENFLTVLVPPTRSDILHTCDLAEDVAIAFGYNNVPKSKPDAMTIGGRQPLSVFTDKIRLEVCKAGYMEVVTWILGSHEENFAMLRRENDSKNAVIIENPRSADFGVTRTSLMTGLLKSLKSNIDHPRPIKIFEVGDVVMVDKSNDVGASNNRCLAALYCNVTSGFEVILGLVDRIMKVAPKVKIDDYKRPSDEPQYLPKRQCNIFLEEKKIGSFGIVHPEVLKNFGINDPCTFVEIDIQALL